MEWIKKTNVSMSVCSLIAVAGMLAMGPKIHREGNAEHRALFSEIEGKPVSSELFTSLDNWSHGKVIDADAIKGKVVLIGVVQSAEPKSMVSLASLARYQRKNGDDGLIALAVHPEAGWEELNEKIQAGRVKVQAARDAGGIFAQQLHVNDYPDLYLIDRAGQLRYADIENKSLKNAIAQLLKETPEEAVVNAQREAQGLELAAEESAMPELTSADYANVDWPSINRGKLNAKNYQGQELPVKLGSEKWITEEKEIENKVIVLDFWATWCGPCRRASPMLDELQKKHEGKLEVLAIGGQSEDEAKVRTYARAHRVSYSHLFDSRQRIYKQLQVRAIPHTVLMSTDGIIRWQGNPLSPDFAKAVEQVIKNDPMFAADD